MVQRYLNKISGPLLDRIDLHVEVTPVPFNELSSENRSEPSDAVRTRVIKAREWQEKRFAEDAGTYSNSQMSSKRLKEVCVISTAGANLLKTAMERLNLSARAYDRIQAGAPPSRSEESPDDGASLSAPSGGRGVPGDSKVYCPERQKPRSRRGL